MRYTELTHFSHPKHNLNYVHQEAPYRCDGCKEMGFGLRYRCDRCNFDLHKDCFFAPSAASHPFYKNRSFQFHKRVKARSRRYCDACGRDVKGFVYNSKKWFGRNHDLHPCCINLPCELDGGGGNLKLKLHKKLVKSKCSCCGKKELRKGVTGWSYVSKCKKFHFHVYCVKEMLVQNWERGQFSQAAGKQQNLQLNVESTSHGTTTTTSTHDQKDKKYWRLFELAANIIVSTVLGDPTGAIVGIVGYIGSALNDDR